FWTTTHLLWEMTFVAVLLLAIYYILDRILYAKEGPIAEVSDEDKIPLGIEGSFNFLLLAGVPAAVLFSGIVELGGFNVYGVQMTYQGVIRDVTLLILTYLSWKLTSKESRAANGFTWFPIEEVAKIFAGIFITIIAPL